MSESSATTPAGEDTPLSSGVSEDEDAGGASDDASETVATKRKRKRKNRKKPSPNLWVYVSGLPLDVTSDEVSAHFSKVGLIALNPRDQQPKIKLYTDSSGALKGDCSICYHAETSVKMALDILDGGYIRPNFQVTVKQAEFVLKEGVVSGGGGSGGGGKGCPSVSRAQMKVAKGAIAQALAWTDEEDSGLSKKKALRIVVIQGLFVPADFQCETFSDELEQDIASECGKCGEIEKITVFSSNPRGVAIIKFYTAFAAQECVRIMHGRYFGGRRLRSFYWDGTTDYSIVSDVSGAIQEAEEQKRIDEFGDWLDEEQEELPEEFRLKVE